MAAKKGDKTKIAEECIAAMNVVLSYELHISDAYLSMAYSSMEESEEPSFDKFFEEQANLKRGHGKEFLEYLAKYTNKICLPVFQRPELDYWETGIDALRSALILENQLTRLLEELKNTASDKKDRGLVKFTGKYLKGQKKSKDAIEDNIEYCMLDP